VCRALISPDNRWGGEAKHVGARESDSCWSMSVTPSRLPRSVAGHQRSVMLTAPRLRGPRRGRSMRRRRWQPRHRGASRGGGGGGKRRPGCARGGEGGRRAAAWLRGQLAAPCLRTWRRRRKRGRREPAGCAARERRPGCTLARERRERRTARGEKAPRGTWLLPRRYDPWRRGWHRGSRRRGSCQVSAT
jgi:hypothetical protein